jgi:hypothetical protein
MDRWITRCRIKLHPLSKRKMTMMLSTKKTFIPPLLPPMRKKAAGKSRSQRNMTKTQIPMVKSLKRFTTRKSKATDMVMPKRTRIIADPFPAAARLRVAAMQAKMPTKQIMLSMRALKDNDSERKYLLKACRIFMEGDEIIPQS